MPTRRTLLAAAARCTELLRRGALHALDLLGALDALVQRFQVLVHLRPLLGLVGREDAVLLLGGLVQLADGLVAQALHHAAQQVVQGLGAGAEAVGESVKSWIQNSNQMLAALNKVSAQVSEFANNNINTATDVALKAAKKANAK